MPNYPAVLLAADDCAHLPELSPEEKEALRTRAFDVLEYKDDEHKIFAFILEMFNQLGVTQEFKLSRVTLYRFVLAVSRRYRDVPFHSFYHAFNVTQTLFFLLTTTNGGRKGEQTPIYKHLLPIEVFSLLISALCHDIDHPGLNNDFQKKAKTQLATAFGGKSPLENHHLKVARSILFRRECDILKQLNNHDKLAASVFIERCIMATDLAFHKQILEDWLGLCKLKKFKKQLKNSEEEPELRGKHLDDSQRKQIMLMIMKCSDLSNEIRPQQLAERWAKKVIAEFIGQCKLERERGMEVAAFMDAAKFILPKEQMFFISNLCLPLYEAVSSVFPQVQQCVDEMKENRAQWETRYKNWYLKDETNKPATPSPEAAAKPPLVEQPDSSIWEEKPVFGKTDDLLASPQGVDAGGKALTVEELKAVAARLADKTDDKK